MSENVEQENPQDERLVGLTPCQMIALGALLGGSTQLQAAAAAGVSRQVISHWIHHDIAFQVNLKLEKLAILRTTSAGLAAGSLEAVNFLRSTLADPAADPNLKLKAATLMLSHSGIDQAPARWPKLNDGELVVSSELEFVSRQKAACQRDREATEVGRIQATRKNATLSSELSAFILDASKRVDSLNAKIRKLSRIRRTNRRHVEKQARLEAELADLNFRVRDAENRDRRLELASAPPTDLTVPLGVVSPQSGPTAAYVAALRRDMEHDG